ncbi:transglutaminase family protein [Tundrisphaera lichenicola]|uniref:transglutaminase family protein n=1 Tax=Tundrisphaera lichenicola TaxID=2029860 RepID=UPI003EBBD69A
MLLRISHETKLTYTAPVSETIFEVRMAPPTDEDQTNLGYRLRTTPQSPVTSYRDGMGNRVDLFNVTKPYNELVILATSYIRTHRRPGIARLDQAGRLGENPAAIDSLELLGPSPLVDQSEELDSFVETLPRPTEASSMVGFVQGIMDAVGERLKFEPKVTKARTPVSEALSLGRGVCQDFAHLCIAACRGLGLPARYVSGYINHPGELATHAWCQVWAGERAGWIDIDPTTRQFVGDDHVTVAFGRDYSDVPPNKGLWKGRAEETIAVTVKVEPIDRVPMEWNEWSIPNSRPGLFQSQRMGGMTQRQSRAAYPNQRSHHSGLNQQQGEQQ